MVFYIFVVKNTIAVTAIVTAETIVTVNVRGTIITTFIILYYCQFD